MEEIDFTLMSNLAEEVEREHEGLLPFTEMVNILLAKYYSAQQSVHLTGGESAEQTRIENELSEWGNPSRPPTSK